MVDIDAAIGYVVARGTRWTAPGCPTCAPEHRRRPRSSHHVERGQTETGGWPAQWGGDVASIDATCFRLAELDDLAGLSRPSAVRALRWLAGRQRLDGSWEEDPSLAGVGAAVGPARATRRPGSTSPRTRRSGSPSRPARSRSRVAVRASLDPGRRR